MQPIEQLSTTELRQLESGGSSHQKYAAKVELQRRHKEQLKRLGMYSSPAGFTMPGGMP